MENTRIRKARAEIARLKRDIELKKSRLRRSAALSSDSLETPTTNRRIAEAAGSYNSALPKSSHNIEIDHTPAQNTFIIDEERRTLMTPRAMKQLQETRKRRQEINAVKARRLKSEWAKTEWAAILQKNRSDTDACDRIKIGSDTYCVKSNGARLFPIDGQRHAEGSILTWNEWSFLVCKSGLLRRTFGDAPQEHCKYFTRSGSCARGSKCMFVHDMSQMALCRQFLSARCQDSCVLSHEPSEFNTPICRYHFQDKCSNSDCKFSHILPPDSKKKNVSIWTCRPFAVNGWCDRGSSCPFAHLYNCPDYEELGQCPRGRSCTLTHTATKRIQKMMAQPIIESNVLISPADTEDDEEYIISSYTVDPKMLFVRSGSVLFSVDGAGEELIIDLGSSEDEHDRTISDSEAD